MSSSPHPVSEPLPATEETKPESNLDRTTAGQDADVAQPEEPPNGGYGWICVLCCFWINAHTWGINSSYGIFLQFYLDNDQYPGASALQFAFVGGLSISMSLLVSPAATATTRICGTRVTLLIGVFFETLALIGASFAHETWHLFLSQGVCFGWGMGYLFVGSVGVVPQWFTTKRSFANGIATAGSGIGGLMYNLATNAMIQSLGVAWAFRILGILAFTVNVICALLIKDRNKAIGSSQLAFDYTLFARPEYLLLLGWGFFSLLGYIVLLFSLPSYATSIGLSPRQGSIVGALLNLGQGIGRPCVGIFSDSAGRINIAGFLTVIAGLFCLVIWIFAKNFGVLVFFALSVGSVSGTFWTTIAPVGAEVVGLKELPSALSILWLVLVLPSTFAEAIALQLRQKTGNIYLHAQIFTGLMYIVAGGVCMWLLRAWKIGQMESVAAEEGKFPAQIGAVGADGHHATRSKGSKSNVIKRLCAWKRV